MGLTWDQLIWNLEITVSDYQRAGFDLQVALWVLNALICGVNCFPSTIKPKPEVHLALSPCRYPAYSLVARNDHFFRPRWNDPFSIGLGLSAIHHTSHFRKETLMNRVPAIILIVVGVVLLFLGLQASNSFSSGVSRFFTGSPTDRTIWLLVGGGAALIAGLFVLKRGGKP